MYFCNPMEGIEEIKKLLGVPKDIVITSHRNPDGDALGSSLALSLYLQNHGHKVHVIFPSEYPGIFHYLPQVEKSLIHDLQPEEAQEYLKNAEIVFCLDFNSLDRIDKMAHHIDLKKVKTILIDHHIDPEPFADYVLSDTSASSTSELIFDFLEMLGVKDQIDLKIGECLYTGIITDTGSFKFATSAKLFRIVAELKELGVNDKKLQDAIYNSLPEKSVRLLAHCLYKRMELMPEFETGYIYLTKEDYKEFDIQRGDTEGIVNYLLMMKHIKIAALISEQPTIVKLSLRSKGDISVQEIARNHFNGGGHKNASGGSAYASLEAVIRRFRKVIPNYITEDSNKTMI